MSQTRWLLLIVGLPSGATPQARVSTWRKLKRSGALGLRDSVYLLPSTGDATEMANWIAGEVRAVGGEAQIAHLTSIAGLDDDTLVERFNALRDADYSEIEGELAPVLKRAKESEDHSRLRAELRRAAQRLEDLARIDFFKAPLGPRVRALVEQARTLLESGERAPGALGPQSPPLDRGSYQGRLWATRARPKVDRLASAWLIRHFVDPAARFGFLAEGEKPARDALTFDTFGGDFTHEGDDCTFEVLVRRFGLDSPGLATLAQVVHNADLNDEKFDRQEHAGLLAVVAGLVQSITDDQALVLAAYPVFSALRTAFASEAPQPTARPRARKPKARVAPRRRKRTS
jgi:hypothetical protein